jgi:hypothetical protein
MRIQTQHFQYLFKRRQVDFVVVVMEPGLTRIGKMFQRMAMSHEVPAGSRQMTATLKFITVRTVLGLPYLKSKAVPLHAIEALGGEEV